MEFNNPVPPTTISNIPKSHSSRILYIIFVFLLLFLLISVAWNIYFFTRKTPVNNSVTPSSSNLFESQSAFVTGEITEINGNTITITTKTGKGELRLANNVSIAGLEVNSATPSSDLKSLKTNKLANINAQLIKDEYQVTSIMYIQEPIDLTTVPKRPIQSPSINPFPSASTSAKVK